jgi:hypothetical protein
MKTINRWKIIVLTICLLIIAALIFPATALASSSNVKDTVNEGETVDQNMVLYGPTVTMAGVINGDLVAIGTDVKISGAVNGDAAIVGKNVTINGPISGNLYISALFLVVGPEASIGQDVYFFGNSINTQTGSTISRDLNVIGLESEMSGEVNRRVNALVGPVTLAQKIYEFLLSKGWWPKSLQIGPRAFQYGPGQPASVMAFGLSSFRNYALASSPSHSGTGLNAVSTSLAPAPAKAIDAQRVQAWGVSLLRNLVALLILGLLIVWLAPAQLTMASEQTRIKPWRALLTGLLVFVLGWIVAVLIFALILALGFFFYYVSLPTLGFFTAAIGLMTVGVALSIFWLSIVYFSKIVIAFLLGSLIFRRFIPKYAQTRIWPFLLGVVIYALLASIPYLGWLIAVIATLFGLGGIWMLSGSRKQPKEQAEPQLEATAENPDLSVAAEG